MQISHTPVPFNKWWWNKWHVETGHEFVTCVNAKSKNVCKVWIQLYVKFSSSLDFLWVRIRPGETITWPKGSTVWQRKLSRTRLVPFPGPTDFLQAQSGWFSLLVKSRSQSSKPSLWQFCFYEQRRTNWQKFCHSDCTQNSLCVKEYLHACLYNTLDCASRYIHQLRILDILSPFELLSSGEVCDI